MSPRALRACFVAGAAVLPLQRRRMATCGAEPSRTPPRLVSYMTDIEGNGAYYDALVALSRVVSRDADGALDFLEPDTAFAYGGDAVDRGAHDLRVLRELVAFKRRHPSRVHLILGNRDINKLRLRSELRADAAPSDVWWIPDPPMAMPQAPIGDRLKWILRETMGSPMAFECRREELARESAVEPGQVGDAAVVESYRQQIEPGGAMLDYLEAGDLAVVIGDVLFVHGGFRPETCGKCPPGAGSAETVADWVGALNAFKAAALADFRSRPEPAGAESKKPWSAEGGYDTGIPGADLLQYGMGSIGPPPKVANPTVVYCHWLDDTGHPKAPAPSTVAYLANSGVSKVVTGHQPHGDAPLVIRSADGALEVITADTSYAAFVASAAGPAESKGGGTRGVAAGEVLLRFDNGATSTAEAHGILADGTYYETKLSAPVGNHLPGGGIVKADVPGLGLLVCHGDARKLRNEWVER